jgi:hypothetical protein
MLDEDWYCRLRQLEPAQRVLAPVLTILRGEQNAFSHIYGPIPVCKAMCCDSVLIEIAAIYPACC